MLEKIEWMIRNYIIENINRSYRMEDVIDNIIVNIGHFLIVIK